MSIVLGIDTSSTDLSVGLVRDGRPLASFCRFVGNSHAEQITAAIRAVFDAGAIAPREVERIAAAVGPGSFTGLRIGLAFVKGFCIGRAVPVLPVSSLEILARAVHPGNGRVTAVIDARNDFVYWASFDVADGVFNRRSDDIISPKKTFFDAIANGDHVVIDTLAWNKSTLLAELPSLCHVYPVEQYPLQRGLLCALAGAHTPGDDPCWRDAVDVQPNYIRRSMPEERLQRETPR